MNRFVVAAILLLSLCTGVPPSRAMQDPLKGGGSTLVYPIMQKWIEAYRQRKGVEVDYASTGSGKGITGMIDKSFDFGCTDAPLSDSDLQHADGIGGTVVSIPLVMGAVAPIYNLPEVSYPIRFTGAVLADIFLGKIQKWNDPALVALNPPLALPDKPIAVVHRLDSSGTTYVWTDYLSKVSPAWKESLGAAKVVNWPVGVAANGNEGVAGMVKQVPGSLGYAQLSYGIQDVVQYGVVQNAAGDFVAPQPAAITVAATDGLASIPADLRFSITDVSGKGAYPISGVTWAVVYVKQPPDKGQAIADFLHWVLHDGQQYAIPLYYAPLSPALIDRADEKVKQITMLQ